MYRRCPSAKIVSKANDDFPDPLRPVITVRLFRGISTSTFFRLCTRAPQTLILSSSLFIVMEKHGISSWRYLPCQYSREAGSHRA